MCKYYLLLFNIIEKKLPLVRIIILMINNKNNNNLHILVIITLIINILSHSAAITIFGITKIITIIITNTLPILTSLNTTFKL